MKKILTMAIAALAVAFAGHAVENGDIYEFRPITPVNTADADSVWGAAKKIDFKMRLIVPNPKVLPVENRHQWQIFYRRGYLSDGTPNPSVVVNPTAYLLELLAAKANSPLQLGIVVSGQERWCDLTDPSPFDSDCQFDDITCTYVTKFGDLALPIKLAIRNGEYVFNNNDIWGIGYIGDDGKMHEINATRFENPSDTSDPRYNVPIPERPRNGSWDLAWGFGSDDPNDASKAYFVKTVGFDDQRYTAADATVYWRGVREGVTDCKPDEPTIRFDAMPADPQDLYLYVWSEDDDAVTLKFSENAGELKAADVFMTNMVTRAGGSERRDFWIRRIRIDGSTLAPTFKLKGVTNGRKATLVLSATPYYQFQNMTDHVNLLADFLTAEVVCIDPPAPTVSVRILSTNTDKRDTANVNPYDDVGTRVATLSVELTGNYDFASGDELVVRLDPKLAKDGVPGDPAIDYFGLSFKTETQSYLDRSATNVVFEKNGDTAKTVYVYAWGADAKTYDVNRNVAFVPSIADPAAAAFGDRLETAYLLVKPMKPVVVEPVEEELKQVNCSVPYALTVKVSDTYNDMKAEEGYEFWYKRDVTTDLEFTQYATNGVKVLFKPDADGILRSVVPEGQTGFQPQITWENTSTDTAAFYLVSPKSLQKSDVRTIKLFVKPARQVEIVTTDGREGNQYIEGDDVNVRIRLLPSKEDGGSGNDTGDRIWAFLVPQGEASNVVSAVWLNAHGKTGRPIEKQGFDATGSFTLLDGTDESDQGAMYDFRVELRTKQSYDEGEPVPGFESKTLTVYSKNVIPHVKEVSVNSGTDGVKASGGRLEWPLARNVTNEFELSVADGSKNKNNTYDITTAEDGKRFKTRWRILEPGAKPKVFDFEGNPNTNVFRYAFTKVGTATVEVMLQDKDMGGEWGDGEFDQAFTFEVDVIANPTITVSTTSGAANFMETDSQEAGGDASIDVRLSMNPVDQPLLVELTVVPPSESAADNPGVFELDCSGQDCRKKEGADNVYLITFDATETATIGVTTLDGTALSRTQGFTFKAKVLGAMVNGTLVPDYPYPDVPGETCASYFKGVDSKIKVTNVAPQVDVADLSPQPEMTNKVAIGVADAISWTFTDVAPDFTNALKRGVTVTIKGGVETFETNVTSMADASGSFAPTFKDSGLKVVTLTFKDKDNGSTSFLFYYEVAVSKTLIAAPHGPTGGKGTSYSKRYQAAAGLGEGHVYGSAPASASLFESTYNCQLAKRWTVWGFGYKVGAVDDGTLDGGLDFPVTPGGSLADKGLDPSAYYGYPKYSDRHGNPVDSFLYAWLQIIAGEDSATLTDELLGGGISPEYAELAADSGTTVGLPTEVLDDGTYDDAMLEAIFSREYLASDNMGDINQDGIPDLYVSRYGFDVLDLASGEVSGDDLKSLAGYNADEASEGGSGGGDGGGTGDYLPGDATAYLGSYIPGIRATWTKKFTADLEIRGFGEALNDAPMQLGITGVKPDRIYEDPDLSPTSTLSKVEWYAWSEFKAAYEAKNGEGSATVEMWSPERPTDPTKTDTDEDGLEDGFEYYYWYLAHVGYIDANGVHRRLTGRRYDERNPGEGTLITSEELEATFDPRVKYTGSDADMLDTDNDGLPDLLEFELGTNPFDFDTDGDGLPDGWELCNVGNLSPLDPASHLDAKSDTVRNSDGDAMAITSYALEKQQKPVKLDFEHAKRTTFAVIDPNGDTDGVQWYAVKGAPADVAVESVTNAASVWSFEADGRFFVSTEKPVLTAEGILAKTLAKGVAFVSAKPEMIVTPIDEPEPDGPTETTNYVAAALYPVRLAAGTPVANVSDEQIDGVVTALAADIKAADANACWIYGRGPQNALYGEVAKTAADYGCLALGRQLAAKKGAVVCALPDDTRDVAFLHYLVYQEFGFDARTAWCAEDPLAARWDTNGEGFSDQTTIQQGGYVRTPSRTRDYANYDEFLVYSFFVNNGCTMSGLTRITDPKADPLVVTWDAFTTNPQGPNEKLPESAEGETKVTSYGRGENGCDTDGDGVPDGWELYIMAGPKRNGAYVFAPPYAGFTTAFGGEATDSFWSPFLADASSSDSYNPIYVMASGVIDTLSELREFSSTDACAYYAKYSTTILPREQQTGAQLPDIYTADDSKWLNKFLPTDPWNNDTDGDGIVDSAEKDAFAYGTPADDGKLWSIPGGGLNPCSVDTDLDGLPDGWENQYAQPADGPRKIYPDDADPKPFRAKDADGNEIGNPLEGLVNCMDGTVPDAYNIVNGDESYESSAQTTWTRVMSDGRRWSGHVNRDYDRDGLENWQEYLVGTMRCWRYDDPVSPWTFFDESVYFDEYGSFDAVRSAEILGIGGEDDDEKEAAFWYETLVNSSGPFYNPHLVTGMSPAAQYFSRVTNAWDAAFLDATLSGGRNDGAYYYFKDRVGGNKIEDTWASILPLPDGSRKAPSKYISCSPIDYDTDCDGMDDYYELFHGLNPLLGASGVKADGGNACDIVFDAWCNKSALEAFGTGDTANYWQRNPWKTPRGENGMDFEVFPYLAGLQNADPDGDDILNNTEFLQTRMKDIGSHTDPTPVWMTDSTYSNSLVRLHYRIPMRLNAIVPPGEGFRHNDVEYKFSQFDGWGRCGLMMGFMPFNLDSFWNVAAADKSNWMFSFEENEGFDTDHDALGDREERDGLYRAATDPLDADSPRRRQAMYFPGENAALQTMPETREEYPVATRTWPTDPSFLNFTVECWAKPEDLVRDQTVVERAVWVDPSNAGDQEYLRKNFQLAIRGGKWFAKYDSGTLTNDEVKAFSRDAAEMKWTHLAATFDGSEFRFYVDGVCQNGDSCGVETLPEYGASAMSFVKGTGAEAKKRPGDYAWDSKYDYKAILVGASFKGASEGGKPEALDVTSGAGWSYYKDFFKGYVDEIRIWDGARLPGEIAGVNGDMMKRYTAADAKANRDDFYGFWAKGQMRYEKATTVRVTPELRYHFHFDSVPGAADVDSVMKAPTGFQTAGGKPVISRPVGYAIDWFAKVVDAYGTVYGPDCDWVQWIPNTVAHLPRYDGTTLDSFFWSADHSGAKPDGNAFANSAEPVSRWTQMAYNGVERASEYKTTAARHHLVYEPSNTTSSVSLYQFTGRHLNQAGDDLLPLGGAFVKYADEMWDGEANGPSTQWEHTGVDSDGNMIPDWYEEYVRRTYGLEGGIGPDTDVFAYGRTMKVRELYLIDLARGVVRTADGKSGELDESRAQVADVDKDGIPDWWEEAYRVHTRDTDLTVGHALDDPDNDGLANISEYAACTGAVLSADQTINPLARVSDGFTIDYFRKLEDGRYLGEVQGIADHDMMEDAWEDLYDVTRANRWIWDALADRDGDGWSNYAECRAGTDPTRVSSLIFEGIEKIDFPIPTVELTLNRPAKAAGSNDTVIVEAWQGSDTTGEPDAVWTVGSGYSGEKSKFLGRNTGRTLTFNCGPGSVVPGSFKLSFKDPTADSIEWNTNKTEIVQSLKVNEGENVWANSVLDMQRSDGGTLGDVVWRGDGDTFIGTIDYQTGLVTVDLSKVAGWDWNTWSDDTHCIRTYIDKSYLRADWTSKMLTRSVDTTLYLSEPDKGALREGPNTFVARSEDGSLAGVARNVNVGWSEVKDLVIELTADSAVFPRFEAGVNDGEPALVKIVRKSINGIPSEKIVMRKRGVEGQHLFTEAEFVRPGEFDLDWTTLAPAAAKAGVLAWDFTEVEYEVTVNGAKLDTFTKTFESVRTKPDAIAFSPTADQDNLLLSVSPTFRWTGPKGYTAFQLQVSTNGTEETFADGVVYDSDARFLPVLKDGTYEFAADCYLNEHLADGQTYFWRVAMLNAKFADAEGGWSAAATFKVAADSTRLNTGYGKAAVDVRYYGSNDFTRADVVVGLYRSADFTDAPVALQHLADGDLADLAVTNVRGCVAFTTNSVALFDGLKPGKYYAMAFIDSNTNGVRDAWESWGYFNNVGTGRSDLYTPMTIDVVANRAIRGECVLFMEDTDVNRNGIPDCIEDMSGWSPAPVQVEDADLDGDGMPDDWEDLMGDGALGFPTDDPEIDAAYAAAGDVMAYAEVDRVLVTFEDFTQALVMKGVLKRPVVGDLAASCNEGWYEDVYAYGDRIGLGLPFHIFDTELRITKVEDVKVVLVHAQVYDEFGYNMKTANAEAFAAGVAVNTKEFTALDKYLVWTYLRVIGYTDEEDENWLNWLQFTLKPGTIDQNLDGVADGWNLYVMFGPATVFAANNPAMAPCTPWMDASVARDEDRPTPGGEGLTWVQEYDGGHYPTDPWQWSTIGDRFRDGYGEEQTISDKDAYAYFLKHYEGEEGDKYADFDNDGLANYDEYDIMKNNNRALAADNMFSYFGSETVPALAGQCVPDYFLKSQRRSARASEFLDPIYNYLGFDYTSHDFIESWWKDQYTALQPNSQEKYVDRTRFETYDDPDGDGWDNWSEARVGTDPDRASTLTVDGIEQAAFPIPQVVARINVPDGCEFNRKIVIRAYLDGNSANEANVSSWSIGATEKKEDDQAQNDDQEESGVKERVLGFYPGHTVKHFNLGPGAVTPGTFRIDLKDLGYYNLDEVYKNGRLETVLRTLGHPASAAWETPWFYDLQHSDDASVGDVILNSGNQVIGSINYLTGEVSVDFSYMDREYHTIMSRTETKEKEGSGDNAADVIVTSYSYRISTGSQCYYRAVWKSQVLQMSRSSTYYLTNPDNGNLRQGPNTFVAFADNNGNGEYDPGEPFGCAKGVQVGWDKVVDLNIDLAATSPVLPRFNPMDIGEGAGTNGAVTVEYKGKPVISDLGEYQTVRIVRWEINGDECTHRTVLSKTAETLGAITEADVLSDNSFDLDWNYLEIDAAKVGYGLRDISSITYAVFVDGLTLSEVKEENVTGWIVKSFPGIRGKATPVAPLAGYKTAIVTATRPTFEFRAPEGYPAFAFELRDEYGNVIFESTEHIGAKNAAGNVTYRPPVFFEDNGEYSWRVAMLNAKYRAAGDWSDAAAFTVELAKGKVEDTDKGALDVAVRYYGDATGPIIVQAFRTADFTGVPEGQTVVYDTGVFDLFDPIPDCLDSYVDTNTVNAKIYGLAPGDYYICAFVDETGDLKRRRWESWGYVNNVGTDKRDLYTPVATKVMRNDTSTALLFIEDADCDNDDVPDWMDPPDGWDPPYPPPPYIPPVTPNPPQEDPPVTPPDVPTWFPHIDPAANDVMAYEDLEHTLLVKIGKTDEDPASQWYAVMDLEGEGWKLRDSDIPLQTFATNIESLVSTWAMGAYTGIGTNVTFTGDERVWDTKFETVRLIHAQVYAKNGYNTLTANGQAYAAGKSVNTKPFTYADKYYVCRYLENIGVEGFSEAKMIAEVERAIATAAPADVEWAARKVWRNYALDPDYIDMDRNDIDDGWEMYVMFGVTDLGVFTGTREQAHEHWTKAGLAISPWNPADGMLVAPGAGSQLKLVEEFDGGFYPTDPWHVDTDKDGVIDFYAYQYCLKGDQAGEDLDGDGLSSYAEYLISEVFKVAKLDPKNPKTDGFCVDYFRKMGDLYVGEIFTDHDQVDDIWEGAYDKFANRYVYDPDEDLDRDGWSNYAEFRAGTDPTTGDTYGVDEYTRAEYPVPVIEAKVIYNGNDVNLGPIVFKAWNDAKDPDMTSAPDAIWTIGNGKASETTEKTEDGKSGSTLQDYEKYVGRKPSGVQRYALRGGTVGDGTIEIRFMNKQFTDVSYPTNGTEKVSGKPTEKPGDPKNAQWYLAARDDGNGHVVTLTGKTIGTVDYAHGVLTVDFGNAAVSGMTAGDRNDKFAYATVYTDGSGNRGYDLFSFDDAHVLVKWQAKLVGLTADGAYTLGDADPVGEGAKSHGHVREGLNTFICFADTINANGVYDPGEPFGVVRGVDVGWQGAKFTVELTETSPITDRIQLTDGADDREATIEGSLSAFINDRMLWAIPEVLKATNDAQRAELIAFYSDVISNRVQTATVGAGMKSRIRVVRYGIDDMFCYSAGVYDSGLGMGYDQRVVMEKEFDMEGRDFVNEADFLGPNAFDIDWGTMTGEIVDEDGDPVGTSTTGPLGAGLDVTNMTYLVVVGDGAKDFRGSADTNTIVYVAGVISRRFELVRHTPWIVSPSDGAYVHGARPTFRWSIPDEEPWAARFGSSYTAFRIQISKANGGVVYDSGIRRAPAQTEKGVFEWTADAFAGDQLPVGNYTWKVSMYNAKFRSDKWSESGRFSIATGTQQETDDHNYSSIDVSVKYTGPDLVLTQAGFVRVQAFETADFSGTPVAQTRITDTASVRDAGDIRKNGTLIGLPFGTYYVRAYIDTNKNGVKDDWESWGGTKEPVTLTTYQPAPIDGLYIEDADTDQDWLPDAWEYAKYGNLSKKGAEIDPEGRIVLKQVVCDDLAKGQANISKFLSGASLTFFQNIGNVSLALGLDAVTEKSIAEIRAMVEKNIDPTSVKITSLTVDATNGKVYLTVAAKATDSIAGYLLEPLYEIPKSTDVTIKIYRKENLATDDWKLEKTVTKTIESTLSAKVEVDTGVNFNSGFYKVEIVRECEEK